MEETASPQGLLGRELGGGHARFDLLLKLFETAKSARWWLHGQSNACPENAVQFMSSGCLDRRLLHSSGKLTAFRHIPGGLRELCAI